MKVLIVTNNLGERSGWERYSLDLVNAFLGEGINVVVVCQKRNDEYKHIKQLEILPNPLSLRRNQILSWFYAFRFFLKSGLTRPDIVHCFVEPYALFTFIVASFLRVKYFLTIHGSYGVKGFDSFFYKFFQIFSYRKAEKLICISHYTKAKILKYKKLDNVVVIPNGVRGDLFSNIRTTRENNSIISVSGLLKNRKGQHITLEALSLLKNDISDFKYHIVGARKDTVYCDLLDKIIEKNKLKRNVIFHGNVPDEDRNILYESSKIFVLNPVSDEFNFEGFGLVYLEANAFGLPVIGSLGNGGEDAIKDGYNGFLVHNENKEEIAQKIKLLLEDNILYNKMSANAKHWVKEFSWDKISKRYLDIYVN